jgi:hypothetical protein
MGCLQKSFFFFLSMSHSFWLAYHPKKNWKETPQNKSFYWKIEIPPPLAYLYSRKEDNFWAKHMGHLCDGIGNILWNTLGIWGTFWELEENTLGTWKTKNKIPTPHFPGPSQEKKKTMSLFGPCSIALLVEQIFYSYICFSQFSS